MRIFCDLEGVLAPEMWPHAAARLAIPALAVTTREQPDYAALVATRVAILRAHGVTLAHLCDAVADLAPFAGAVAFVAALRAHGPVTLVTDSFAPMNRALVEAFALDRCLGHRFVADAAGFIAGWHCWNDLAGKQSCLEGVVGPTLAIGDAFNDLAMLRSATRSILFQPSAETREAAPDLPLATTYAEVIAALRPSAPSSPARRGCR